MKPPGSKAANSRLYLTKSDFNQLIAATMCIYYIYGVFRSESMDNKTAIYVGKLQHIDKSDLVVQLFFLHLFFIACLCLCGQTVGVVTSQGHPTNLDHTIFHKTTQLFWWKMFHWNMLFPLAQTLCNAKHVLLFWKVGSLVSINTSNPEELLLWGWLGGAAFGGVIVLGSGVKTVLWASDLLMKRNQMIKYV